MLGVLWIPFVGVLAATASAEFEFHFHPRAVAVDAVDRSHVPFHPHVFDNAKNVTNETIKTDTFLLSFGKQTFKLNVTVNFDDANFFVFDKSCAATANLCKKGTPKITYDPSLGGNTKLEGKQYTMKDPSDGGSHMYTGDIYEDKFVLGNITFKADFGVITGATNPQAKEDVHMGLGYRAKGDYGFDENTEPIRKILEQAAENAVLIQAAKEANQGQITFGKKNDTGCLSSVLVDAKMSAQNVLQWSFEFKQVQGNKVTVTDDSQRQARFDLSTPYIIMPTSLAKDIGQDSFTEYSQMPDIVFDFGTEKIVLTPEQYSQKQGDKYKAMIQNRDDPPGFVLGTQFMHGRCILLDAENKKIGISQLPPTKAADANLPAVLLVAVYFGLLSVFRF